MANNHFTLHVGDGENFIKGQKFSLWAIRSKNKKFLKKVRKGDILWFIRGKRAGDIHLGKVIAMAVFESYNKRELGPLINTTMDNYDLGWSEKGGFCDIEIHYSNMYNLSQSSLFTGQKRGNVVCDYDNIKDKLLVNLRMEYESIVKYLQPYEPERSTILYDDFDDNVSEFSLESVANSSSDVEVLCSMLGTSRLCVCCDSSAYWIRPCGNVCYKHMREYDAVPFAIGYF